MFVFSASTTSTSRAATVKSTGRATLPGGATVTFTVPSSMTTLVTSPPAPVTAPPSPSVPRLTPQQAAQIQQSLPPVVLIPTNTTSMMNMNLVRSASPRLPKPSATQNNAVVSQNKQKAAAASMKAKVPAASTAVRPTTSQATVKVTVPTSKASASTSVSSIRIGGDPILGAVTTRGPNVTSLDDALAFDEDEEMERKVFSLPPDALLPSTKSPSPPTTSATVMSFAGVEIIRVSFITVDFITLHSNCV